MNKINIYLGPVNGVAEVPTRGDEQVTAFRNLPRSLKQVETRSGLAGTTGYRSTKYKNSKWKKKEQILPWIKKCSLRINWREGKFEF